MKILLLTQWFDPEPHFKGLLFAKALQARGHSVQVLTGFPNYPGGKVYPGYKIRLWQREVMEGVPVLRVALYPSHSRSAIGRAMNYISFALSASILGTLLARKADVAYVYHPPITIGLPAICLKYLRRIPFVYDIQDLWPDTLTATGMVRSSRVLKLLGWWCRRVYRASNRIAVLSPGFKKRLRERGVPEGKISVIYNWSHPVAKAPSNNTLERQVQGKFVILFAGNMGAAQGLDTVLDAAKLVGIKYPAVCFALAGSGVDDERLRQRVKSEGIENVIFLGRWPPKAMGTLYTRADALLVHLRDEPLFEITIPSKTQTYLAAGKPILIGGRGDALDLVRAAQAGIVFAPGHAAAMAEAVDTLLAMSQSERERMGCAGQAYYDTYLSLAAGVRAFEEEFARAAGVETCAA